MEIVLQILRSRQTMRELTLVCQRKLWYTRGRFTTQLSFLGTWVAYMSRWSFLAWSYITLSRRMSKVEPCWSITLPLTVNPTLKIRRISYSFLTPLYFNICSNTVARAKGSFSKWGFYTKRLMFWCWKLLMFGLYCDCKV